MLIHCDCLFIVIAKENETEINQLKAKLDLTTCRLEGANHTIAGLKLYLTEAKGKGKGDGKELKLYLAEAKAKGKSDEDQSRHKVTGIGNIKIFTVFQKTNKNSYIKNR